MAPPVALQAVTTWPALVARRGEFEAWLEARTPRADWKSLNLDDLALCFLSLHGERKALAEVERRLQRVGRAAAARRGDDDFIDEVLQQARHKLFVGGTRARLNGYRGQGALVQYLKAVVSSLSVDLARSRTSHKSTGDDALLDAATGEGNADSRLVHLTHRAHFTKAFKVALTKLSAEERTWLRMRFVDGLSIDAVGTAFGVHRTTAMRWLEKAQHTLMKETRRSLAEQLGLPAPELESMMRAMRPSLAENLSRLLPKLAR